MVQTPRQEGRTTMGEDRFEQLMRQHGMKRTHAGLATIRFEKKDLSIETRDSGETFIVRSESIIHSCPNLSDLAQYLETIPKVR
jgi:hypothetical protein